MVVVAHALMAPPWSNGSLAAYYRRMLMCSVLCKFFLRERTRHDIYIYNKYNSITTFALLGLNRAITCDIARCPLNQVNYVTSSNVTI